MNDIAPLHAAQMLKQYGLWASKGLGQNFLEDPSALQDIADAAEITNTDTVLEIGPGLGSLTRYLAARARQVVAVELDDKLLPALKSVLKPYRNVRVLHGDILELSPAALDLPEGYIVAANIPYNITSAILRHLLASERQPRRIVLTIQREVAQRICASPPDMSLLALSVQVFGKPSILLRIPREAFFPVPTVDSAVVRVDIYSEPAIAAALLPGFFELIKAGFSQKRKMLRNALSAGLRKSPAEASVLLTKAGIDPQRRAETLSLPEWERLTQIFRETG
ncbi:MAG: 16S rRNA (adenine(1518)-N(6)/adenine(1519)-N(6))-dimethyltransferase RsmA [Anaerolineae bacterium]